MDLPDPAPKWPYLLGISVYLAVAALDVMVNREPLSIYYDIVFGTTTSQSGIQQRALLEGLPLDNSGKEQAAQLTMQEAADKLCDIGTALTSVSPCFATPESPDESFEATLINTSPYHVDILWDSDGTGTTKTIANLEGNGAQMQLTVFKDNQFLVALHPDETDTASSDENSAIQQRMADPKTQTPHAFQTSKRGQTFVIPKSAFPMIML